MFRRVVLLAAVLGCALSLSGCGLGFFDLDFARREAWRGEAERACFASHSLMAGDLIERVRHLDGKGVCGMDTPLRVTALVGGTVKIGPNATLGCPQTAAVERWLQASVEPAALSRFGSPVVAIKQISSYSCRTIDSIPGESLSEHAFGNALDVAAFILADGREIEVESGWNGTPEEQAFLREAQYGACQMFSTVLAPGSDKYHYNHIHLDLARRSSGRSYCKPAAVMPPPPEQPALGGWQMVSTVPGGMSPPQTVPAFSPDPPPLPGFGPPASIGMAAEVQLPPGPRPRAPIPLGYSAE